MTDTYELPPIPMAATDWHGSDVELMLDFARLAVKAERERCALLCEERAAMYKAKADKVPIGEDVYDRGDGFRLCAEASEWAAAAIRKG